MTDKTPVDDEFLPDKSRMLGYCPRCESENHFPSIDELCEDCRAEFDEVQPFSGNIFGEWDGTTAWIENKTPSELHLLELPLIDCPNCGQETVYVSGWTKCCGDLYERGEA